MIKGHTILGRKAGLLQRAVWWLELRLPLPGWVRDELYDWRMRRLAGEPCRCPPALQRESFTVYCLPCWARKCQLDEARSRW